jgi:hypothetical protein
MVGGGVITDRFFDVLNLLLLALLCFKVFVFVDALIRPARAYEAAGKLTKVAWLLILGISALYDLKWGSFTGILTIVGAAAAIIYMVDVRPALRQIPGSRTRKDGGRNDRQHDGPYGPW